MVAFPEKQQVARSSPSVRPKVNSNGQEDELCLKDGAVKMVGAWKVQLILWCFSLWDPTAAFPVCCSLRPPCGFSLNWMEVSVELLVRCRHLFF